MRSMRRGRHARYGTWQRQPVEARRRGLAQIGKSSVERLVGLCSQELGHPLVMQRAGRLVEVPATPVAVTRATGSRCQVDQSHDRAGDRRLELSEPMGRARRSSRIATLEYPRVARPLAALTNSAAVRSANIGTRTLESIRPRGPPHRHRPTTDGPADRAQSPSAPRPVHL